MANSQGYENIISNKKFDRKCQICQWYGKMANKIIGQEMEIINIFRWSIWKDIGKAIVVISKEIRGIISDRVKSTSVGQCRGH